MGKFSKNKVCWIMMLAVLFVAVFGIYRQNVYAAKTTEQGIGAYTKTETYINPLYADEIKESELIKPVTNSYSHHNGTSFLNDEEEEYLTSYDDAGSLIREAMTARQEQCVIYFQAPEYNRDISVAIMNNAVEHTGVPTEGDYLKWQYKGFKTTVSYYMLDDSAYLTYTFAITYYTDADMEEAVTSKVNEVLAEIDQGNSYEKVKAAYAYICDHVTYDYDNLKDETYKIKYTAYGALINGTSVCQGYAALLYRLCLEMGIDCRVIPGIGNGGDHGWNIIKLGKYYYNVDSTWDSARSTWNFFLRCEEDFPDHTRDEEYDTEEFHQKYRMSISNFDPDTYVEEIPVKSISLDKEELSLLVEEFDILYPTINPADATNTNVTWKSSDESVATVSDGFVTAVGPGIAIITVTTEDGEKTADCTVTVKKAVPPVSTPEILSVWADNKTSTLKITWTKAENASGYELFRTTKADADPEILSTSKEDENKMWYRCKTIKDGETTVYKNGNITSGESYYYMIRAYVGDELDGDNRPIVEAYSEFSPVMHLPGLITFGNVYGKNFEEKDILEPGVRLNWEEVKGAEGYQIERADSKDGAFKVVKTMKPENIESWGFAYSNRDIEAGHVYYYRIRAYITDPAKPGSDAKVFGLYSKVFEVATPPKTPVLTAESMKATKADLSWEVCDGAIGYQVWISDSEDGNYSIAKTIKDGAQDSCIIYELESEKTYYFMLRAYIEVGGKKTFSQYSDVMTVKIK